VARPRITARCETDLADLGTEAAAAIIEKFYELRAEAPTAGERVSGLQERPCASLHSGRYRAVTWYDQDHDVVWLLAAGIHRADSREDAYDQAIALERAGQLYPTDMDYAQLAADERHERLEREARALAVVRDEALAAADGAVRRYTSANDLYAELWAEVVAGLEEAEVVLRLRLRRGSTWLTAAELATLLAAVFLDQTPRQEVEEDYLFRRFAAYVRLPMHRPSVELP
jgi:hypothetical protein